MINRDENQNQQANNGVVKVDAATFFNDKFKTLEDRLIDTLQISSRQSSRLFEKITGLVRETRQLSETFDQKAFDNAIEQLKAKLSEVQLENQENVNKILVYLERMGSLMTLQKNGEGESVNLSSFDDLYTKFDVLENKVSESLYIAGKQASILYDRIYQLLANKNAEDLQPEDVQEAIQNIDDAEQALEEEQQQARAATEIGYRELDLIVKELYQSIDYDLLAHKIVAKLPKQEEPIDHSFTFVPTGTFATETTVDYDLLTEKIVEKLPNISVDTKKIEDRVVELLNTYLPVMASNFLNYDILVDKIVEKLPSQQTVVVQDSVQAAPQEVMVQFDQEKFTESVIEQLGDLTESIINYDLLAEKLSKYQPTTPIVVESREGVTQTVAVDEDGIASKVVSLLPEFVNYALINNAIEDNIKLLEGNIQNKQQEILNAIYNQNTAAPVHIPATTVAEITTTAVDTDALTEKVVDKLTEACKEILSNIEVSSQPVDFDNTEIIESIKRNEDLFVSVLLHEIPAMMEASLNYDLIAEKLAQYIQIPAIESSVVEIDYDLLVQRITECLPAAQSAEAMDYDKLAYEVVNRMPVIEPSVAEMDYDKLAEKVAEYIPAVESNAAIDYDKLAYEVVNRMPVVEPSVVEVDYDRLAEKVAEYIPAAESNEAIDYDKLAYEVVNRMPVIEPSVVEVDYDRLAEEVVARIPATEAVQESIDYDRLVEQLSEKLPTERVEFEVDYDTLADKVAARMPTFEAAQPEIDYDVLAEKVAAQLKDDLVLPEVASVDASALDFADIATTIASHLGMQNKADSISDNLLEKFNEVNDKIDRVQDDVNLMFNAYKLPEMTRLDKNIAIYNYNKEEENLVAVLLSANTIVAVVENHLANGNKEVAEQILGVLFNKLNAIKVHGASKIQFVVDTLNNYGIDKHYSEENLMAFMDAVAAFSATDLRFDAALANAVIDSKFNLLQDIAQNKLDRSLYLELENVANGYVYDKENRFLALKEELIALPLSIFVDYNIPTNFVEVCEDITLPVDDLVEAIYDRLHGEVPAPKTERKTVHAKKKRILRPALSKRDNLDDDSQQNPSLKIVHRKIDLAKPSQSLFATLDNAIESK